MKVLVLVCCIWLGFRQGQALPSVGRLLNHSGVGINLLQALDQRAGCQGKKCSLRTTCDECNKCGNCGFCADTPMRCLPGTKEGPTEDGSCSAKMWFFGQYVCNGPPGRGPRPTVTGIDTTSMNISFDGDFFLGLREIRGFNIFLSNDGGTTFSKYRKIDKLGFHMDTLPTSFHPEDKENFRTKSAAVTGLLSATKYHFRTTAYNDKAEGDQSKSSDEYTTLPSVPHSPEMPSVVGAAGAREVELNWGPPLVKEPHTGGFPIDRYNVNLYQVGSGPPKLVRVYNNSKSPRQNLKGLTPYSEYEITVTATNRMGTSLPSPRLEALKTKPSPPDPVTQPQVKNVDKTSIEVSFVPGKEFGSRTLGFQLWLQENGKEWTPYFPTMCFGICDPQLSQSVTFDKGPIVVKDGKPATNYQFKIITTSPAGNSVDSDLSDIIRTPAVAPHAPGVPQVAGVSFTSMQIEIPEEYDGGSPVINYLVKVQCAGENEQIQNATFLNSVKSQGRVVYLVVGLATEKECRFSAQAVNAIGSSPWSEESEDVETLPLPAPPKPARPHVVGAPGETSLTLSWAPLLDGGAPIQKYKVYQQDIKNNTIARHPTLLEEVNALGNTIETQVQVDNLQPSKKFRFFVTAVNANGESKPSPFSNVAYTPCSPPPTPKKPTLITLPAEEEGKKGDIVIEWAPHINTSPAITTYKILVNTGGGYFEKSKLGPITSTVLPGKEVQDGSIFRIVAVNADGCASSPSAASAPVTRF